MAITFLLLLSSLGHAQKKSPQDVVRELDAALKEYDKKINEFQNNYKLASENERKSRKTIEAADKRLREIKSEKAAIQKVWPNNPNKWAHLEKEYKQLEANRSKAIENQKIYYNQSQHYANGLNILKNKKQKIQYDRQYWSTRSR